MQNTIITILMIASIIVLLLIFYQDWKFRAVSWILFPLIILVFLIEGIVLKPILPYLLNSSIGLLLVVIELSILFLVFKTNNSLRSGKDFFDRVIGWGDIIIILSLCFALSPLNLVLFLTITSILALVIFLPFSLKNPNKKVRIPLAGLISLMYIGLVIPLRMFTCFDPLNDVWIENTVMNNINSTFHGIH